MSERILIAAATRLELQPVFEQLDLSVSAVDEWQAWQGLSIAGLVTGAGSPLTAYALGKTLPAVRPDLLVHIGIAGCHADHYSVGQCVRVVEDRFADIGAESADGQFLDMFQLQLWDPTAGPWSEQVLRPREEVWPECELPTAKAITVHTIPGTRQSIDQMRSRYDYSLETMEGAAVFQVALAEDVPFICLRGISNLIEPRNRSSWDIDAALRSVNTSVVELMKYLCKKAEEI